jgi:hypothetical protein
MTTDLPSIFFTCDGPSAPRSTDDTDGIESMLNTDSSFFDVRILLTGCSCPPFLFKACTKNELESGKHIICLQIYFYLRNQRLVDFGGDQGDFSGLIFFFYDCKNQTRVGKGTLI